MGLNPQTITISQAKEVNTHSANMALADSKANDKPKPTIMLPQADHQPENTDQYISSNVYPLPQSITITVQSNAGAGALNTRCYLLNPDLANNPTNNGSGADSIVTTYQDGFAGKIVSNLLKFARAGMGAICYGVAVRMTTNAGVGNAAGLNASNPVFYTYNALGSSVALPMNVSSNQQRSDFDTSIEVLPCVINIGAFVQFSLIVPVSNTATITMYFTKNF